MPTPTFITSSAVFLDGNAPSGGAVVSITSSDPSVVQLPQPTVTIPRGPDRGTRFIYDPADGTGQAGNVDSNLPGQLGKRNVDRCMRAPPLTITTPTALAAKASGSVEVSLNVCAPAGGAVVFAHLAAIHRQSRCRLTLGDDLPLGSFGTSFPITNTYAGKPKSVAISRTPLPRAHGPPTLWWCR